MRPVPQLPKLSQGALRNCHMRIEREAIADPRFAEILPQALERHRQLQVGMPGKTVFVSRMSFTPDVLHALRLKIVAQ